MSHFTVMVRVPGSVALDDVEEAVAKLLLPYKESGCGSEDPPELKKYLVFKDIEDESMKDYKEKTKKVFVDPSGKPHSKYSERFRSSPPGSFGIGSDTKYICPGGWTEKEIPFSEFYSSFEKYMKDWEGHTRRDPSTGRFGYWKNPNQKWDWWQIGGRWTGKIPVKPWTAESMNGKPGLMTERNDRLDRADVSRIKDIDWDAVTVDTQKKAEEFWLDWEQFCAGREFPAFDGPRERALNIGLLACKDADELTGKEWKTIKWPRQNRPGVDRFDVLTQISREDFFAKHLDEFGQINTFARLDQDGWKEKGEMGWFGMSDQTPESTAEFNGGFTSWLRSGDQSDWAVVVDCHI